MGNLKFGSKTKTGLCHAIIARMLPHSVCIESHLAGSTIFKREPAALHRISIIAFATDLMISQMVPLTRTAQLLKMTCGRQFCEATLLKRVRRLHETLAGREHATFERLLEMPVLNADETSIRVNRKNRWIHSCSFADIVIKKRHPKRGAVQQQPSRARLLNGKMQRESLRNLLKLRSCPSLLVNVLPRILLA